MIGILDYNAGNVKSVINGFRHLNIDVKKIEDIDDIKNISGLVIPGVGSFKSAYINMKEMGITKEFLLNFSEKKKILGICLGMQIMYEYGEEDGGCEGFGFFEGTVKRIPKGLIVPHMGWNKVEFFKKSMLNYEENEIINAYFAHSYMASIDGEEVKGKCNYGKGVAAIVEKGNIFGVQFHPEKSGETGLRLLKKFGEICYEDNTGS